MTDYCQRCAAELPEGNRGKWCVKCKLGLVYAKYKIKFPKKEANK